MNGYLLLIFSIFLCSHVYAEDSETLPSQSSTSQSNKPDNISVEATSSELDQLIELVNSNDFSSAYQLGQSMVSEWEGDEQYDFHFALSAAQEGHYNQAIFSFERLLSNHPNNDRFRIELARCHFFLKNYQAAEYEFNNVKNRQPPEAVLKNINGFLAKIAEQKQQVEQSWNSGGSLSFGHDSNINAATDLDNVDATLFISNSVLRGRLNLDDEQKSQESTYYQAQAFSQFQKPLSKRSNLDAFVFISNKDNAKNDTYDLTHASIDGGFRILRSNHNFRIGAAYRHYWLEYKTLQDQLLANIRWQWHFSPGWNFTEALELGKQNNDQNNSLDYHQWQSKSSLQRNISDFNQTLSLSLGSDASIRSANQFQGRDYFSLIYQLQKGLTEKQRLFALINYRENDYQDKFDDQHIFYANKTRSDQLKQIIAGWSYAFTKNISSKLQISHSQNDSNLDLYEYQRTLVELGFMVSFN